MILTNIVLSFVVNNNICYPLNPGAYRCWDEVFLSQELSLIAQESKQGVTKCYNLIVYFVNTSFTYNHFMYSKVQRDLI